MPTEEYRKLVDERIGRAVREGSCFRFEQGNGVKSKEEFDRWLKNAKRNQLRKRWRRMVSVAAVFLCLILGSGLLYHLPAGDPTFAGLSHSDHVEEQGGSIVIGGDGNGNVGIWTATFTSYEDIPEQYKDEIVWFEGLPEGYELKEIKMQRELDSLIVRVNYWSKEGEITVKEVASNEDTARVLLLNNYQYYGEYAEISVYYKRVNKKTRYSFYIDDMIVVIDGIRDGEEKGGSQCLRSMVNTIT